MSSRTDAPGTARRGAPLVLVSMCLGLMLSMFNSTQVNVTLPAIAASLHASPTELQWVSAVYTLCYAATLLPGGALGNRLGRRTSFLGGVAIFVIGSLGCALAPTLPVLLAARVAQALGAAIMLPQTLAILVHEYDEDAARARAVGIWAGVASLGLAAGPILGGVIVSVGSWRWGFVLSALLGVFALALAALTVPTARHGHAPDAPPVDLAGAAVSAVALVALAFGLIEAGNLGWGAPAIVGAFLVAAVAIAGFLVLERGLGARGRHPIMPLGIWRSRRLVAANLAGLGYFFAFFGILYFFSVDLQQQRGLSPLTTGLAFLPMMIVMALLGPVTGRLSARVGAARLLGGGLFVAAAGCALLALLGPASSVPDIEWRLLLVGVGAGLMSSPMSNLAVSSVERRHSSTASAVHNMCRQIGSTLGVAVLGAVIGGATRFSSGLDRAMLVTSALLAVIGVAVWALTGIRSRRAP